MYNIYEKPYFRLIYNVSFLLFVVLEMEPRVSQMLGMHSTTETMPTTLSYVFSEQDQVTVTWTRIKANPSICHLLAQAPKRHTGQRQRSYLMGFSLSERKETVVEEHVWDLALGTPDSDLLLRGAVQAEEPLWTSRLSFGRDSSHGRSEWRAQSLARNESMTVFVYVVFYTFNRQY